MIEGLWGGKGAWRRFWNLKYLGFIYFDPPLMGWTLGNSSRTKPPRLVELREMNQ